MKTITITQKDILKAGIQNTEGFLIDELAYSAGQWTSDEMLENSLEYEPQTPYDFDFEEDLFVHTKTLYELTSLITKIGLTSKLPVPSSQKVLQAGACFALEYPVFWDKLLTAYTKKLQEDFVDGISENYNKTLQEEIDEYHKEQYKEWLNGDYRDYRGVVEIISEHFTSNEEGSYNEDSNEYTFCLDDEDVENFTDMGYKKNQLKRALLDHIKTASDSHMADEKRKREIRMAELTKLKEYKAEQAKQQAQARKAKLEAMTL